MEKTALFLVVLTAMLIVMLVIGLLTPAVIIPLLRIRTGRCFQRGSLDNLIQLTPVQPDAPAFRTEIDLDTLTFCYIQWDNTNWTIHFSFSFLLVNFSIIIKAAGTHEKPETGRGDNRNKIYGIV